MTTRKKIGDRGEDLATNYLFANGFDVLNRNYRVGRSEIDIIAKIEDILVFIEVKTRRDTNFGYPESFVSEEQQARIHLAAEQYIEEKGWQGEIRFDILAITWDGTNKPDIEHFEDAL